tara:strand:- start:57 stop:470 length:414 start_codon:yes stop_codon:yes gene_type:complete
MARLKIFNCDRLWSKYIRTRDDWTCQRCGKKYNPPTSALHCSHYFTRGNWSVRFDEDNTEALCYGCHSHLGGNPHEHTKHKLQKLGQKKMDDLIQRKNNHKSGSIKYFKSKEFCNNLKDKIKQLEKDKEDLQWLNDK